MSVPTGSILDGAPPYGTKGTIAIPTGSTVYIILEEKCTPSWAQTEDKTATGLPNRSRWVKERYKLDLSLQLSQGSGVTYGAGYPTPGQVFAYTPENEASALNFVVLDTPEERSNSGAIEVAKISAIQVIGSVTTSST